ncbi:hypothetical protein Taro_024902 [Colocasia esculenta]|uniref:Receptor-like serine/threonine-protein kinase n=1 Tax=Colocasia esculenta TaxID=4460 RepID=A0A843VLR7_COLES|nr:hypothetical protein [Colocasia esculenta]
MLSPLTHEVKAVVSSSILIALDAEVAGAQKEQGCEATAVEIKQVKFYFLNLISIACSFLPKKNKGCSSSCVKRGPVDLLEVVISRGYVLLPWALLALLLSFSLHARLASATSTISPGLPLTGDATITSQRGKFVLGFFTPGRHPNSYIGIWFKKIPKRTPVWVANRAAPVHDPSSSQLTIAADGNLVLLNRTGSLVWSTNATASIASNSTVAELLDTGNLVLRDGRNSSRVFWQSFDHPTDTWLPGGKLGLNKVTGEAQWLVSWKNSEDPAPGIFSLEIDPNGSSQYYVVWNSSVRFWTSGIWDGRIFSNVPEMVPGYVYNFAYISNAKENYFTYSSVNEEIISRFVVDLSGQIKQLIWVDNTQGWTLFWTQPKRQCDVHRLCGPFGVCDDKSFTFCSCVEGFVEASPTDWNLSDRTSGCVRRTPLQCESRAPAGGGQDGFYAVPNVKLPENGQPLAAAGSAGNCEAACLGNCSCTAYSYGGGCSLWHHDLFNLQQLPDDGATLHLRLAATELQISKSPNKKTIIVIVAGAASAAIAFVLVLVWRHRRAQFGRLHLVDGSLLAFSYGELKRVTRNFSEKLGAGGFGSVFKGTMPNSTQVAVKMLEGIGQGEKQFRMEVSTIGTIQHVNLVRLRGFCSQSSRRLLVYDYMPMGSLDNVLFRSTTAQLPSWEKRYQIILGTARGLAYLHEECRDRIIHCDIKPENILLDASFVPKVADFGLAKLVGRDFSRVLTTMRGTRGYLAPEWISGVAITAKADVYSYGMMLFEIVSGRRNSEESVEEEFRFFPSWAATRLVKGEVRSLLDPRLGGDANLGELDRVLKVAYWCIQDDETERPSMGQVVQILEGVKDVGMPPMPRFLLSLSQNMVNPVFFTDVSSSTQSSQVPTSDVSVSSYNKSSTSCTSDY